VYSANGRLLAVLDAQGRVQLWEMPSRLLLTEFAAHTFRGQPSAGLPRQVGGAAFFPDGWKLALGHADTSVVVWDLPTLVPDAAARAKNLTAAELDSLWIELAGGDGPAVWRAQAILAAAPDKTTAFFQKLLQPVAPVTEERLKKLLDDLDAPSYATRTAAVTELTTLGDIAVPALVALQKKMTSLEVERRVQLVLVRINETYQRFPSPLLRTARAVHILERFATPQARKLLETLTGGDPRAPQTRAAAEAYKRLAKQTISQ
jgi:hypothetical protein